MPTAPAVPDDAPPPRDPPGAAYTVSVRSLCEFGARAGDLDRRFTPSATALEGQDGQRTVAARRGAGYRSEIALQTVQGDLQVRGRADGFDPSRQRLEEIKTVRGAAHDVAANRRRLHWAQLQTYGALWCRAHGTTQLTLALVYFDTLTQTESEQVEVCAADDLEAAFVARCAAFAGWARQEAAHRAARNAALRRLPFPPGAFRPGQRALAAAVYRAALEGRCLQAQAPTGIGKTLGTLFPALRAVPGAGLDKLAWLTCKGTGRIAALDALQALRRALPDDAPAAPTTPGGDREPRPLRVLVLQAREAACEHPDRACHGDSCPLARGFFDRLPAARVEAVATAWLDPAALRRIALQHGVCPYYLGQELMRWTDVLVGDVHHALDPHGGLWALAQAQGWRLALLVDEAHNLVERTRAMYSAELPLRGVREAAAAAPAALRRPFAALLREAGTLLAAALQPAAPPAGADAATPAPPRRWPHHAVLEGVPQALLDALQALSAALGEHFQRLPAATGALLQFHFALLRFTRLAEGLAADTLFEARREPAVASGAAADAADSAGACADARASGDGRVLALRCVVPARHLRPRWAALHHATLFSATLGPPGYLPDLLGLPADALRLDVPPVFPPEHLQVRVAERVSTRWAHRTRSLRALGEVLARQFDTHPGNYLAFFSSFDYLQRAAAELAARRPDLPQWRQERAMDGAARQAFLDRFRDGGRGIGFAVLGGVFAEGVDLPGTRLIGAFVATLGLPPVSAEQEALRQRLARLFGEGADYADRVPALQKVVQAAGRVLRTPHDRGHLWLLDDRYRDPAVQALLPAWWGLGSADRAVAARPDAGARHGLRPSAEQPGASPVR